MQKLNKKFNPYTYSALFSLFTFIEIFDPIAEHIDEGRLY